MKTFESDKNNEHNGASGSHSREIGEEAIGRISDALKSIRYGHVQIIVQDSRVVQIDVTRKIRFDRQNLHRIKERGGDDT